MTALGPGMTVVVEQVVIAAGPSGEPVHRVLDDRREPVVIAVAGLSSLEEGVGILGGAAQHGMVRREGAAAVGGDGFRVDQGIEVVVGQEFDLGDLMGGSKPIEEVEERHAAREGGRLGDAGEVVGLLDRVGGQQREPGLTARHDVGMIAEDRERVGRQGSGGHVHREAGQLPGDLVHGGDHQEQALRCREGRGQAPGLQGAMDGTDGAAFRLHLGHVGDRVPEVPASLRGPLVARFTHRRGGRDRIEDDDFVGTVRHRGHRFVGIKRYHAHGFLRSLE